MSVTSSCMPAFFVCCLWVGTLQGAEPAPAGQPAVRVIPAGKATKNTSIAGTVDAVTRWDTFTAALRAGRMHDAYECFSPLSRRVMSYREFCGLYSPLTAATEAVLSVPEESRFQFTGDKAVLRYVALPRAAGEPGTLVQAFMVREGRDWFLVSEKRWPLASAEADARSVLRQLCQVLMVLPGTDVPADYAAFAAKHPEIAGSPAVRLVESQYAFELVHPDAKGWLIIVRPKDPASQLRGFAMNMNGELLIIPGTGPQDAGAPAARGAP